MSKSIRAAVFVATAAAIIVPGGAAVAAETGELGVAVSQSAQPYGTLAICAGRADGPASTIRLIRNGNVVKQFRLAGCTLLRKSDGLTGGRYKVRHTAPNGYRTTGWIAGGTAPVWQPTRSSNATGSGSQRGTESIVPQGH